MSFKVAFLVVLCLFHSAVSQYWMPIHDELHYARHLIIDVAKDIISHFNYGKASERKLTFQNIERGDKMLDLPYINYRLRVNVKDANGTLKLYEAMAEWELEGTDVDFAYPDAQSFRLSDDN